MIYSISWILPLFNEEEYAKIAIPAVVSLLGSLNIEYEVIVVNDASSDHSLEIIKNFSLINNRVKVISHEHNRGLGAALRTGFNAASKEIVIYTDIDMPFDFLLIKDILPLIEQAEVVHGYRTGKRESFKRVVFSAVYNLLFRFFFHLYIKDINFAFDILKRENIKKLDLKSEASFISTEILTKSSYLAWRIIQVPVQYRHRSYGVSHLSSTRNIFKLILELVILYPHVMSFKFKGDNKKRVIINADDFGLTSEVNKGVVAAFRQGVVTSASILATGKAFSEAIDMVRENDGLGIGVHLCLTEEYPVLPILDIPTLVDMDGRFHKNWSKLFIRLIIGKISLSEVRKELEAQIKKVINAGIVPTHIDSHQHIHLLPKISAIVINLAVKYGIKNIRYPKEDSCSMHLSRRALLRKIMLFLPLFFFKRKIKRHMLNCSDHFLGINSSGRLNLHFLESYLKRIMPGTTEIVCHPGEEMPDNQYKHWGYFWKQELDCLTSAQVRSLIKSSGVELVNYRRLDA